VKIRYLPNNSALHQEKTFIEQYHPTYNNIHQSISLPNNKFQFLDKLLITSLFIFGLIAVLTL